MTRERYELLADWDSDVQLTQEEIYQGWHFCSDFDGLLIGPEMSEYENCTCEPAPTPPPVP